jgi:hypothetical protein
MKSCKWPEKLNDVEKCQWFHILEQFSGHSFIFHVVSDKLMRKAVWDRNVWVHELVPEEIRKKWKF